MTPIDVEYVGESVFEDSSYGIVVGKVVVLPEVPVLIEVDGSVVGCKDMQVDCLTMVVGCCGNMIL